MAYPALLHHTRTNAPTFDPGQGCDPWRRGAVRRSTAPKEPSFDACVACLLS